MMSADAGLAPRPRRRTFTRHNPETRLSPECAERQWLVTHLALALLDGHDKAIAFLNTHNVSLGARPLDLAIKDAAGYSAVERAMRQLANPAVGTQQ